MAGVEVRFEDVDGDGDREVVVENPWLRTVLRFPEKLRDDVYGPRFTWGGRLQSLVYKPTGREYFMTTMLDPEGNGPFGLPDELFAFFPMTTDDGLERWLKMGVGVFTKEGDERVLEPLPWTWHEEIRGEETVVVFRQEAADLGGYSFLYEKQYRFRPDASWFAMDVVWENRGDRTLASDWDIHSFHQSGTPPNSAWLLAPKRAWVSYGKTRLRTVLKESSPIFATPDIPTMVADYIEWDLDEPGWWYALGPGDGEEFYLLRGRFEPYRGLFWHGWEAFTPQGVSHVEVPPGDRVVWGFDVTLGVRGKHFVKAGEDCGLVVRPDAEERRAVVGVHVASRREGALTVEVLDQANEVQNNAAQAGSAGPGEPLEVAVGLPEAGEFAVLEATYREAGRVRLNAREIVPLAGQRPTAHLPFTGGGARVFVANDPRLEWADADGRYLYCHGTECGFVMDRSEPGVRAPETLDEYAAVCIVGDAWPLGRAAELRAWVESGGGLLICAPFGPLAKALGDLVPLAPEAGGGLEIVDPQLGLVLGTPHFTAERLMLHPDALVRISQWTPVAARPGATVTLRFTDAGDHPAVVLSEVGKGRIAAVASRPAWGNSYRSAVWDGWGQYHRACFGGLIGWAAGAWQG